MEGEAMTPEEVERELAIKVMGWHISAPWGEEGLKSYTDKNNKSVMLIYNWYPLSDWNQLIMCVEKFVADGNDIEMGMPFANAEDGWAQTSQGPLIGNDNFKLAIAEVILKTISEE